MFEYLKSIGENKKIINKLSEEIFNAIPDKSDSNHMIFKSIEMQNNDSIKEDQSAKIKYYKTNIKDDSEIGFVMEIYPLKVEELRKNQKKNLLSKIYTISDNINKFPDEFKDDIISLKETANAILKSDPQIEYELEKYSYENLSFHKF